MSQKKTKQKSMKARLHDFREKLRRDTKGKTKEEHYSSKHRIEQTVQGFHKAWDEQQTYRGRVGIPSIFKDKFKEK